MRYLKLSDDFDFWLGIAQDFDMVVLEMTDGPDFRLIFN